MASTIREESLFIDVGHSMDLSQCTMYVRLFPTRAHQPQAVVSFVLESPNTTCKAQPPGNAGLQRWDGADANCDAKRGVAMGSYLPQVSCVRDSCKCRGQRRRVERAVDKVGLVVQEALRGHEKSSVDEMRESSNYIIR